MKKSALVVAAFALVLTGGAVSVSTDATVSKVIPKSPEALLLDENSNLNPPALTVSTPGGADSVIAACGNYEWSQSLPDGLMSSVIACGAHPLDERDYRILYTGFSATTPLSEDGGEAGSAVPVFYLAFDGPAPGAVSVIRWPADYIGDMQYSADFEKVKVELDGDTISLLPPGDGDYVYAVSARWGSVGRAEYTFRTVP